MKAYDIFIAMPATGKSKLVRELDSHLETARRAVDFDDIVSRNLRGMGVDGWEYVYALWQVDNVITEQLVKADHYVHTTELDRMPSAYADISVRTLVGSGPLSVHMCTKAFVEEAVSTLLEWDGHTFMTHSPYVALAFMNAMTEMVSEELDFGIHLFRLYPECSTNRIRLRNKPVPGYFPPIRNMSELTHEQYTKFPFLLLDMNKRFNDMRVYFHTLNCENEYIRDAIMSIQRQFELEVDVWALQKIEEEEKYGEVQS